jgi:tetratricopeptide (TPR) repeat protein
MTHIDDDVLDEYVIDVDATMPGRAAIEAHLNVCAQCRERVGSTAAFLDAITSPEVWETTEAVLDAEKSQRRLLTLASRIQIEYADANEKLSPFLKDGLAFVRERVERRPEYRTAGAVRLLAEAAHASCEREPIHARNIAEAAVAIADQLALTDYPESVIRTLRGVSWKEHANAMRFIGEYPQALASLDRSEREFRELPIRSIELGNTAYIRAVVLIYMDRLEEAERHAAESAEMFAAFGDTERWVLATAAQAAILYYRAEYAPALAIFERLLKHSEANNDAMEIARHSSNAGVCCIQMSDTARAAEYLLVSREIFVELDNKPELARTERWLGVLSRVGGNVPESVRRLRSARRAFEQLALLYDAALTTIDLVESLIVAGQMTEIAKLCGEAMRYLRASGNRRQAFIAAAYLKQAANKRRLSVQMVEHVRKFVQQVEVRPSLRFEPPVD